MKRILWAIDPYQTSQSALKAEASAIKSLVSQTATTSIEPVFVVTPGVLPSNVFSESLPSLKRKANRKILILLKGFCWSTVQRPKILDERSDHVENVTRTLLKHAKSVRADLIVLRTHGKQGISKLILGSFAETLLLNSPIPLLIVNPNYTRIWSSDKPTKILFPTDFEEKIEENFAKVARLAREQGSRIDVVHVVKSYKASGISSLLRKKQQISSEKRVESMREQFLREARRHGVEIKLHLLRTEGSVADEIISSAKRLRPLMIAMNAKSGELKTLFAGSVTRQVVRASPCPVWAIHRSPKRFAD